MTRKRKPVQLTGNSGSIYVGSGTGRTTVYGSAVASGGALSGFYGSSMSWWVDPEPVEPSTTPTTPGGVLERILWDLGADSFFPHEVKGILIHALTWHLICQHEHDRVAPEGYIANVPIRTSWDIPEYEWVFAYNPAPKLNLTFHNDLGKTQTFYDQIAKKLSHDAKSSSIKARKR